MNLYLDTSLLVASLTRETKTSSVQAWLRDQSPDELAISDWVVTEFSAALSIKLRAKQIAARQRADALAHFAGLVSHSLGVLSISARHFSTAARFADHQSLGLKAGDALHLAVAADEGAMVCTLDRKLADAGKPLGIRTLLL